MAIPAKLIGNPVSRLYSCEFAVPGKWTCIIEVDEFAGSHAAPDQSLLPSVGGSNWVCTKKELARQEAHLGVYHYTYECATNGGPSSPSDLRSGDLQGAVVSASVTLTRQPIGMHQKFAEIKRKYGGRLLYGEWDWPQIDPTGTSTRSGTDKNGNTISGINPMYGVQEYLAPSVTLRASTMQIGAYATPSLSGNFGFTDTPPGEIARLIGWMPSSTGSSGPAAYSEWLMTENSASQHGADLEITKGWQSGQWNNILYTPSS